MSASASSSDDRVDAIEQIFQRVEEESARRAQIEAAEAEAIAITTTRPSTEDDDAATQREAEDTVPSPVATVAQVKQRRRGSVSVSRFGQPTELSPEPVIASTSAAPSTRPSRSSSLVQAKPPQLITPFYQVHAMLHGSADSLASASANDPENLAEDQQHVTKMATILGKQSLSKAITRRLSRARSRDVLVATAPTGNVVIGVAVEEATVEHDSDEDHEELAARPQSSAAVYSGVQVIRHQRSSPGLNSGERSPTSWMAKAKEYTSKFKRRSIAALAPSSR
ncbi:hypothetical protein C8Q75DRAFT_310495 [Abortiporus biennis]|nr:hypothetical protein C8Q75DRAFT_310495 [Abortiporus biennis]